MAWEILVPHIVHFPLYQNLETAYQDYRGNPQPAGSYPTNQCAVRMSVALGRCGFSLYGFADRTRIKRKPDIPVPYVLGAEELAKYLAERIAFRQLFRKDLKSLPTTRLGGRKGIIYFSNCFKRKPEDTKKKGDHIDLWNGRYYYNQVNKLPAGAEDPQSSGDLFKLADEVWFFELA